jgi:hypothetical protein
MRGGLSLPDFLNFEIELSLPEVEPLEMSPPTPCAVRIETSSLSPRSRAITGPARDFTAIPLANHGSQNIDGNPRRAAV